MIVTEVLDGIPVDDSIREIQRDEKLLHIWPESEPLKIWRKFEPLGVISLPMHHVPGPFAPPQGVFRSDYIHIEYQKMNGRQPFYHRNTDADEITYQAFGKRTVLTELGSADYAIGDMARIPVGVAHDNYAQEDVHIIFYIPQGVLENVVPYRSTEYLMPPFPGWEAKESGSIEFITEHLSEIGTDCSTFYTDEQMLLDNAKTQPERMAFVRSSVSGSLEWLYKGENVWLGIQNFENSDGKVYTRHRMADELQIQTMGKRTLITQRGTLQIEPGDFVSIPLGCAFTSVAHEANGYISVLMRYPAIPKKQFTKMAEPTTEETLIQARKQC
jgi:hypothetical protein